MVGQKFDFFIQKKICSKSLLYCLNDTEQSSAIGSSVVLKFFIQIKGSELFHAIPEFVKEALHVSTLVSEILFV